ncbi:hypothetical protein [Bacillus sp. Marseille-P3661]|nr:hypothetical protein [Bacillus sp. Marseille-P3661]
MSMHGEVTTFNLFDLTWEEIVEKGFEKYIDKEKYEKYQESESK